MGVYFNVAFDTEILRVLNNTVGVGIENVVK